MKNKYLNKTKVAIATLFAGLFLFTALSGNAQCMASFSYTAGANGAVNFQNLSTNVSANTYYWWSFGDGNSSYGQNVSHTYTTNGTKVACLHLTDSLTNCNSTACDSILITTAGTNTVNPCSHVVVYSLSKDSTQALTWNAYPSYPPNIASAVWSWGDGSSSAGLYPSHTYSAAGTYSTCVTIHITCDSIPSTYCYVAAIFRSTQSTAMITLNVKQSSAPTGIKTLEMQNELVNIYPNPNNGLFTISLNESGKDSKVASVSIYNMLGEKVFEKNDLSSADKTIHVSELPNGTYFVRLVSTTGYANKKISIQK